MRARARLSSENYDGNAYVVVVTGLGRPSTRDRLFTLSVAFNASISRWIVVSYDTELTEVGSDGNNRIIHDLTACINNQMIVYKRESEIHFQSKYLYVLNPLPTWNYTNEYKQNK
jgi:hypothetical protein